MIPEQLRPYLDINAALFQLRAGTKDPTGIVANWKSDAARDRAQIEAWADQNPGCNWAMYAAASGLIVVDIDVKNVGRGAAWQTWIDVCASWGIAPIEPTVSTPSGGWHCYLRIGRDVDVNTLNQPALAKGAIDIRANGFVLIPPSVVNGKSYTAYQ